MESRDNILVNTHNFKTLLSRFFKIEFSKIKLTDFNANHNRNLYDKFDSDLDLIESENLVGVNITDKKIDFNVFEDYNNSIVDDDNISYGQCIGNYIVNKKIKPSDYTLFLIAKECKGKVINVEVLVTKAFNKLLKEDNISINRNFHFEPQIAHLNQVYFGNTESCFSLN